MKRSTKVAAAILMAAGLTFALSRGGVPAMAEAGSFSEGQVKSIEKIVKEYLINHPEIMLEVQEAYEKKVEVKRG